MSAKEIEIRCPCCTAKLFVDVRTGAVLRASPAAGSDAGAEPKRDAWDAAQQRVRDRSRTGAEKLESALEDERTKEARFDDLFKKATEKHARGNED